MIALPRPEPGLVLHYSYLWLAEMKAGRVEGTKDRPVVVVLATRESQGRTFVTVLPVTHSLPREPGSTVELPRSVKEHLGLDEQRSWVVTSETNEFIWPGYDLRQRPGRESFDYGFIPPRFFDRIVKSFLDYRASKTAGGVTRD